jgi:hypothetical protein
VPAKVCARNAIQLTTAIRSAASSFLTNDAQLLSAVASLKVFVLNQLTATTPKGPAQETQPPVGELQSGNIGFLASNLVHLEFRFGDDPQWASSLTKIICSRA